MSPEQITVDCGIPKSDAIRVTFGENCRIQLCLFHVSQCWSRNLATQVMNSPGQHSNAKVTAEQPQFVEYFEDKWIALDGYKRWSAAYVIEEHQNMRISNYIESWHNPLKSVYLKRTKNRRLDRLVYILVNEVENDIKFEEARVSSEVGRMGPETRNKRKRETVAADIPDDRTKELITKESETTYNVESFSQEDIMYTVQINETGNIVSCSCSYFKFNSRSYRYKVDLDSLRHSKRSINAISDYEFLTDINCSPDLTQTDPYLELTHVIEWPGHIRAQCPDKVALGKRRKGNHTSSVSHELTPPVNAVTTANMSSDTTALEMFNTEVSWYAMKVSLDGIFTNDPSDSTDSIQSSTVYRQRSTDPLFEQSNLSQYVIVDTMSNENTSHTLVEEMELPSRSDSPSDLNSTQEFMDISSDEDISDTHIITPEMKNKLTSKAHQTSTAQPIWKSNRPPKLRQVMNL
ncbi:hypothetical protein G6F44_012114 [Rhizopus delemar]|nr:hypothetical protein G6F44_012114 [Rhizopus delemar]